MVKLLVKFTLTLTLWAAALFAFDFSITQYFLVPKGYGAPIVQWHAFMIVLTLLGGLILLLLSRWHFHYTGFAFMALMLVKMGIALYYLWPMLQPPGRLTTADVLHFMALYLSYLLFETVYLLRYLNKSLPER